jgi:hypothetical protein
VIKQRIMMMLDKQLANHAPQARRRIRLRVRIPATIEVLGHSSPILLLDITLTGAKIAMSQFVRMRHHCVLRWMQHRSPGRVVWQRNGFCGVAFDEAISPSVVLATLDRHQLRFGDRPLPYRHAQRARPVPKR